MTGRARQILNPPWGLDDIMASMLWESGDTSLGLGVRKLRRSWQSFVDIAPTRVHLFQNNLGAFDFVGWTAGHDQ
jgi:hypothetical protein